MRALLLLSLATLALTSCCDYSTPPLSLTRYGGELCAHHHIPRVAADGFHYEGPPLPKVEPTPEFDRVMRCYPNGIRLYDSLTRPNAHWKPAKIYYCPKCEEAIQRWLAAHPS